MNSDRSLPNPQNLAVITTRQVIQEGYPVLYVAHDTDGEWQFLPGGDVSVEDALVVSLESMVERDASLAGLADLPAGWEVERPHPHAPWQRRPCES
jgi:hypothetical protein